MECFKDVTLIVAAIIASCAAIIGSCVGISGLSTWRKQLKVKTEYEMAKKVLIALYELRESIYALRGPLLLHAPKENQKGLPEADKNWNIVVQAYQNHWAPISAAKAKLDENMVEVGVVRGEDIVSKLIPLNGLIYELNWAISDYLEQIKPKDDFEGSEKENQEETKKFRDILYPQRDSDKDDYKKRLEKSIGDIEIEMRSYIIEYHH